MVKYFNENKEKTLATSNRNLLKKNIKHPIE